MGLKPEISGTTKIQKSLAIDDSFWPWAAVHLKLVLRAHQLRRKFARSESCPSYPQCDGFDESATILHFVFLQVVPQRQRDGSVAGKHRSRSKSSPLVVQVL